MENKMPVICTWCGKVIEKSRGNTMGKVSNGCCLECRDKILENVQNNKAIQNCEPF